MSNETLSIEARVTGHPFLSGMTPNQLKVLVGCAKRLHFEAGETVFRTGEAANGFYLIESGEVAIDAVGKKKPVTIDTLSAGDPLGWSWIFEPYRWQYDARAKEPTVALFFDADVLRKHRGDDLMFGHELFKRMCEVMVRRLQSARGKLADVLED
ncbi:MAG: cyclic nucleotide-binding domain-containing protein [Chthoniobacterales bacterium]|nr:cyclic nucleotide-binding domain-containing protein [Chthoniobacterales bacterium]